MINKFFIAIVSAAILTQSSAVAADQGGNGDLPALLSLATIMQENYLPDFSFAGYSNGAVDIPIATGSIIEVDDFGAVPSDGKDDTKAILAAVAHAHAQHQPVVVRFHLSWLYPKPTSGCI